MMKERGSNSAGVGVLLSVFSSLGRMNILDIPLTSLWACHLGRSIHTCWKPPWERLALPPLSFQRPGLSHERIDWGRLSIRHHLDVAIFCEDGVILRLVSPVGIIIFLSNTCPWVILLKRQIRTSCGFLQEHFLRFSSTIDGRKGISYTIFLSILSEPCPGLALLTKFIRRGIKSNPFLQKCRQLFSDMDELYLSLLLPFFLRADPLHSPHSTPCRRHRTPFQVR